MTVNKLIDNKTAKLIVTGRIDSITATTLDTSINDCISTIDNLILDFNDVEYISSACLRVLIKTQKGLGKRKTMKLIGVSENVMEVFELTGFNTIIDIERKEV